MSATSYAQRVAHSRWRRRRGELIAAGQWMPFVAAGPVRDHVNKIRAAGMPVRALEQHFEMSAHHLDHLLWGSEGSGPGEKVRTETARMLLAYWPTLDHFPDSARIDPTGTRRRIEALQVRGFNLIAVAGKCGMPARYFQKAMCADKVTARMARAVRDVYGAWWDADPLEHGVLDWVAGRTRRAAERQGWYGPLAWDDDTIDDPTAVPQTDAVQPLAAEGEDVAARWLMGESVILGRSARREVLQHLFEWTSDTTEEIAARLEMTPEAAERAWHRQQAKAAAEGRRVWRRVYTPRIKQNDMEEAA
ncbi:hypothetical protein [Streptomyces osmaniensis]|uniref:Uncharacterized protein n=1 Tax=Streptomyces osmaniensis TaxID=593134 RepID=A0ABP6YYE6_9ACTN|nr:hypothetical protein KJK32_46735 [Streptomyces sp. JCM17656]